MVLLIWAVGAVGSGETLLLEKAWGPKWSESRSSSMELDLPSEPCSDDGGDSDTAKGAISINETQ
jgi:hypothetical protein